MPFVAAGFGAGFGFSAGFGLSKPFGSVPFVAAGFGAGFGFSAGFVRFFGATVSLADFGSNCAERLASFASRSAILVSRSFFVVRADVVRLVVVRLDVLRVVAIHFIEHA